MVRVADGTATAIGQALDAGADGVLVPLVESADMARAAVERPTIRRSGHRSGGGVRPLARGFARYVAEAAARTVVGVMIETAAGVENAEAIARVPGIDFVFIGTGDLALSLGCFPDIDHRTKRPATVSWPPAAGPACRAGSSRPVPRTRPGDGARATPWWWSRTTSASSPAGSRAAQAAFERVPTEDAA